MNEQRVSDLLLVLNCDQKMANLLLFFTGLALLVCGVSHAAVTPAQYWKTHLPNTPMPNSIHDILSLPDEMSTSSDEYSAFHFFIYGSYPAATEEQLQNKLSRAFFFKETDLFPGANLTIRFMRSIPKVDLLPRRFANIIPFSSAKLPKVLSLFSIDPNSKEAKEMRYTLDNCEHPGIKGEAKYCATSLESMVDFSISSLGTNDVKVMSAVVSKANSPMQAYTVNGFEKISDQALSVFCHAVPYPYVIFHCHSLGSSVRGYSVSLTGEDGTQVQAVAVCHLDTSEWSSDHLAFQVLKTKPGKIEPVCHLLPLDHILWIPNGQSF